MFCVRAEKANVEIVFVKGAKMASSTSWRSIDPRAVGGRGIGRLMWSLCIERRRYWATAWPRFGGS